MSTKVVTNTIVDISDTPLANVYVEVALLAPPTNQYTVGGHQVVSKVVTRTNSSGVWSLSLTPNSQISPANTIYSVEQRISGEPVVPFYISVPNTAGPFSAMDILTTNADRVLPAGSQVSFDPGNSGMTSTDIEAAIIEAFENGGGGGGGGLPASWTDGGHGDVIAEVDDATKAALTVQSFDHSSVPQFVVQDDAHSIVSVKTRHDPDSDQRLYEVTFLADDDPGNFGSIFQITGYVSPDTSSNLQLDIGSYNYSNLRLVVSDLFATLSLTAAPGQTEDLFQFLNNSGDLLLRVGPTGYLEFLEQTTPSAAFPNSGRLFTRDDGNGNTELCVRFNTGPVQILATQKGVNVVDLVALIKVVTSGANLGATTALPVTSNVSTGVMPTELAVTPLTTLGSGGTMEPVIVAPTYSGGNLNLDDTSILEFSVWNADGSQKKILQWNAGLTTLTVNSAQTLTPNSYPALHLNTGWTVIESIGSDLTVNQATISSAAGGQFYGQFIAGFKGVNLTP